MANIASETELSPCYFSRVIRVSFLAPEIIKMILEGQQPPESTANKLVSQGRLPTSWIAQRDCLGLT